MLVRRAVVSLLAAVGAMTLTSVPVASASSPPAIAYMCGRAGQRGLAAQICVANADGSGERVLTEASDNLNIGPVWSPDGTKIAYLCRWNQDSAAIFLALRDVVDFGPLGYARNSGGEVCVTGIDGSVRLILSAAHGLANAPAWSPDGRFVVYSSPDGIQFGNPSMPSLVGRILVPASYSPDFPAWSPDGTKLAFTVATESGTAIAVADIKSAGLVVPVVEAVKQLTAGDGTNDLGPAWSPDSTQIAFTRYADFSRESWVVGSDGLNARRVGQATGMLDPNRGLSFTPVWTGDGASVIVLQRTNNQAQLVRVPVAGGAADILVKSPPKRVLLAPSLSPDGKTILFIDNRAGTMFRLYESDVRTGKATRLAQGPIEGDSSWRPTPRR